MPTIDQKVVQMQFDNKQFEKGVAQSLQSLEELKKALKLEDSSAGLEELQKSMNDIDVSQIKESIDSIGKHFTVVGRFIDRHVDAILDKMTNGVKNFVKSISVDQISAGMGKYEQYNQSVQMIQSALPEKSVADIEAVMQRLNEYTDLTSYSFGEMANSIGKFTSAGVDLETAEIAMEGISNWAASAGGNVREANIAMYNLSQSLSAGAVKKMDWKSIELANMATKEFKEQVIQAAVSLGVLNDGGNNTGYYLKQTKSGVDKVTISFENFAESLKDGWFNSDVLLTVLSKYADRQSDVGKKGFEMAKIAITWTQAVDAIKDAISTGWMNSFRFLLGNLEEAGQLFTRVSDAIIDFADRISSTRNEILEAWHTQGGYNAAIESAANIWHVFVDVADMVHDALATLIPPITGEQLADLTKKVEEFTGKVRKVFDFLSGNIEEEEVKVEADLPTEEIEEFQGLLQKGMRGDTVKQMQQQLSDLGYSFDSFGADGIFGKETENAVKEFQKAAGLSETGVFDETTWDAVQKQINASADLAEKKLNELKPLRPFKDAFGTRVMTLGDSGAQVEELNKRLIALGYIGENELENVAFYSEKTRDALLRFQKDMKMDEDEINYTPEGIYDDKTWMCLNKAIENYNKGLWDTSGHMESEIDVLQTMKDVLTSIGAGFVKIGQTIGTIASQGFQAFVSILSHAASIIAPFALTIASMIGTLFKLASNLDITGKSAKFFSDTVKKVKDFLKPFDDRMKDLTKRFKTLAANVKKAKTFKEFWAYVREEFEKSEGLSKVLNVFDKIKKIVEDTTPVIKNFADTVKEKVQNAFGTAFTWLSTNVSTALSKVSEVFTNVISYISDNQILTKVMNGIVTALTVIGGILGGSIFGVFSLFKAIGNGAVSVWNFVKSSEALQNVWTGIKNFFAPVGTVFNTVTKAISNLRKNSKKLSLRSIVGEVGKLLLSSKDAAKVKLGEKLRLAMKLIDKFGQEVKRVSDIVKSKLLDALGKAGSFFTNLYDQIKAPDDVTNPIERIKIAFSNLFALIKSKASEPLAKIKEFFTFDQNLSFGENIQNKLAILKNVFANFGDTIVAKFKDIYNNSPLLQSAFEKIRSVITPVVEKFQWFIGVVQQLLSGDFSVLQPLIDNVSTAFSNLWEALTGGGSGNEKDVEKKSGIFDGIKSFFGKLKGLDLKKILGIAKSALGAYAIFNLANGIKDWAAGFKAEQGVDSKSDQLKTIAEAIMLIGITIAALSFVMKYNGSEVWAGFAVIVALVTALMGAMLAVNKLGGKGANKFAKQLATLANAVATMVGAITILTLLVHFMGGDVWAAVGVIAVMVTGLLFLVGLYNSIINKLNIGDSKGMTKGLAELCLGVLALAGAVAIICLAIKLFGVKTVFMAAGVIAAIVVVLGGIAVALTAVSGKFGGVKTSMKGMLAFAGAIAILALVIAGLALLITLNPDGTLKAFGMVMGLIIALGAVAVLLSAFKANIKDSLGSIVIIVVMAIAIGGLAYVLSLAARNLIGVDWEVLLAFFGGLAVLLGVTAGIVAVLGALPIPVLIQGLIAFAGVAAVLGLVVAAFSSIGMMAMENIGAGLFVFGSSMSDFSDFMEKVNWELLDSAVTFIKEQLIPMLKKFIGIAKDAEAIDTAGTTLFLLGTAIQLFNLALSGINLEFLTGIASFVENDLITMIDTLVPIAEKAEALDTAGTVLTDMGNDLKLYNESVNGINVETLGGDVTLANNAVSVATKLRELGDTSGLAAGMRDISGALTIYSRSVKRISGIQGEDTNALDSSVINDAFSAMAEVEISDEMLAKFGGYADKDSSGLGNFATGIANIADALDAYGESIGGIDVEKASAANDILDKVSGIQDKLSAPLGEDGDVTKSKIYGQETALGQFAKDISSLGTGLAAYGKDIGGLDSDKIDLANTIMDKAMTIKDKLNNEGITALIKSKIHGEQETLAQFALDIAALGNALGQYGMSIGDLNYRQINTAAHALTIISELQNNLPTTGGAFAWVTGTKDLGKFASNMSTLGDGVANYANKTADAKFTNVEASLPVFDTLGTLLTKIEKQGGLTSWFTGSKNIASITSGIGTAGEHIADFADKTKSLSDADLSTGIGFLEKIVALQNSVDWGNTNTWGLSSVVDGYVSALEKLALLKYDDTTIVGHMFKADEVENTVNGASETLSLIEKSINTLVTNVNNSFSADKFNVSGKSIIDGIAAGITDSTKADESGKTSGTLSTAIQSLITAINGSFQETGFSISGKTICDGIATGINESAVKKAGGNNFKTVFGALKILIDNINNEFKESKFTVSGRKVCSGIATGISNNIKMIKSYEDDFERAASYLDQGLANGIANNVWQVQRAVEYVADEAIRRFCEASAIQSPSKVFAWAGQMMDMGVVKGLETYSANVSDASASVAGDAMNSVKKGLKGYSNSLLNDFDTVPTIRPVLDLSDVESGMYGLNGMFGTQSIGVRSAGLAGTIDRRNNEIAQIKADSSNISLAASIETLNNRMDELGQRIENMKLVINGDRLVGEIVAPMDRALGRRNVRR